MAERKALVYRASDGMIEQLPTGDTLAGASGGSGVPDGGTLGQVLTKNSGTDGDADWADPTDVGLFKGFRVTKTTSVAAGVGMTMETTEIDSESGWSTNVYTIPASLNGMYMNFSAGMVVSSGSTVGVYIERSVDSGSNWTIIAHQASTLTVNAVDSGPILVSTGDQFRISGYGGNTAANEIRNFFSGHVIHGVGEQGPAGNDGATGANGADGADGQGVPTGGSTGQFLAKIDGTDYNTEWVDPPEGGVISDGPISAQYWRFSNIMTTENSTLQPSEMSLKDIDGVIFTPSSGSTDLTGDVSTLYDGNTATNCYIYTQSGTNYVEYDFGTNITPIYVSISSPSYFADGPRAPTDWVLQYSLDGTNWIDVQTFTGGTAFSADETRLYEIETNYPAITSDITSYTNSGGQGDRQVDIETWNVSAVNPEPLINGSYANANYWTSASATGKVLGFDFGVGNRKGIDEITFYQSNTSTHGVWKIQATNNDIDWTDVSSEFTLGGATAQVIDCDLFDGTPYYKYRFLGVSGTTSVSPYLQEIEFKIADYVAILPNEMPIGGNQGEVLAKATASSFDVEWVPATWKINRRTETASFTLTDADFAGGVYIECDHATVDIEVTIPASLTGTEPLVLERTGAANVTLIHTAVTLNSRDSLDAIGNQHSSITVIPKGSDVFNAQGDLG